MSRKDKLIKSKSIYTVRSKHTSTVNGTIYENDNVTIIPNDGIFSEDIPLFSESNFKFRIGRGNSNRRRHSRGGWIPVDGTNGTIWTLNNLPISTKTEEGHVVIKPNYSSLRDFAYYGSAVELLKATVNDLIMRYPGGISYYQNPPSIFIKNDNNENEEYYLISNEYDIDFWTPIGIASNNLENPMKILGASYRNYEGVNYVDGEEAGTYDINLKVCITGNCVNSIIGELSFTNETPVLSSGRFRKGGDIVFGIGEVDENPGDDETGKTWSTMEVWCYSGTSQSSYNPNQGIGGVPIDLDVMDKYGITQTFSAISDRSGKATFRREDFLNAGLDNCIKTFHAVGTYFGRTFENELEYDCKTEEKPILNLYLNTNTLPNNKFPFTVFVKDCKTNEPVENASVIYYADLVFEDGSVFQNGFYRTEEFFTNSLGVTELWDNCDTWYLIDINNDERIVSGLSREYHVQSWSCIVNYNNTPYQSITQNYTYNSVNVCVDVTGELPPFSQIGVKGIVGINRPIGSGYPATLIVLDSWAGAGSYRYSGYTDENGMFSATYEDIMANLPYEMDLVGFNCEIEYNGVIENGQNIYFSSNDSSSFTQTLYFKESPQYDEIILSVTAYTYFEGGSRVPLSGQLLSFMAPIPKSTGYFIFEKFTDSHGVAVVSTFDEGWSASTGQVSIEDLSYIREWYVTTNYNNELYYGEGGKHNIISNGDVTDFILLPAKFMWSGITVNVIDNNGTPISNIDVTVYTTSQSEAKWEYYALKTTNELGSASFTPSSHWIHIAEMPTSMPNDFTLWCAKISYEDENGNITTFSEVFELENNLEYTFIIDTGGIIPPGPSITSCDEINAEEGQGFFIFLDGDGKKHLLAKKEYYHNGEIIIRPKSAYTQQFWSNLDDFEKVLLDRTTKPIYKAKLETPYIEDNKHYYKIESYVWPTVDGVNPDLTSSQFQSYITSLLNIAEYYDEYEADNMWRMMTHEAIKNLDWSFIRHTGDDATNMDDIDSSRMKAMLNIQSRLYDDIKRYADNIKSVNSITYDEKNNIPDYFLSDVLELNGFDAKNVSKFSGMTSDVIYSSTTTVGRSDGEVNSDFMRRLALSSKYLMSMKGTRRGIEGILGMFGYLLNEDYTISEYIGVAQNFPMYKETVALRILGENEYVNYDENTNMMVGYPVGVVSPVIVNENPDEENYYLIPWIDKNANYYNGIYFQEKGGWGKKHTKKINLSISNVTEINDEDFDFKIYDETVPYMVYVDNTTEMTSLSNNMIYQNMVCYVTDISDLYVSYSTESAPIRNGDRGISPPQPTALVDFSHYFILKNTALSSFVGFVSNDLYHCYGWKNIPTSEFKNQSTLTEDGLRVLYLESLEINNRGNNPHCGFSSYDDGKSYIDKFNTLFGTAIEEGKFEYLKDGDEDDRIAYNNILACGFNIENFCEDNKKCHYFRYSTSHLNDRGIPINPITEPVGRLLFIPDDDNFIDHDVEIDDGGEYSGYTIDGQEYCLINPEWGFDYSKRYEEAAANSVVNIKNLRIMFYTHGNEYFKQYLEDVVFKYLKEMIPSSTILSFEFNDSDSATITPRAFNEAEAGNTTRMIVGDGVVMSGSDMEDLTYFIEDNTGLINNEK